MAALAGVGLGAWCAPAAAPVIPTVARAFRLDTHLRARRGIALTFDDGPHPQGTPAVLEALGSASAQATFFLVGEQVERWPEHVRAIVEAGHEVGCHGYRHLLQLRRTPAALSEDLRRSLSLLSEISGRYPSLYRPPYGVFSTVGLALVREHGCTPLLWSRWGRDWSRRATPSEIAQRAGEQLKAGDVVLLHDSDAYSSSGSWRKTVAALPSILDAAARTGEPLVSVSHST